MDYSLLFTVLAVLIFCLVGLSWFAGTDAPFVPTHITLISLILKRAGVGKGKVFYELGSGDGRVVLVAARLGAKAYGVEQSWIRVWYSRFKAGKLKSHSGDGQATFYHGDIFTRNYFPADIIYIFLLSAGVEKLEPKLKKELKPGSIVITQTFHFKNWKPVKKIDLTKDEKPISKDGKKSGDFWIYKV